MFDYGTTAGRVQTAAWATWPKQGLGVDRDEIDETLKTGLDATHGAYTDGIGAAAWPATTLERLQG